MQVEKDTEVEWEVEVVSYSQELRCFVKGWTL